MAPGKERAAADAMANVRRLAEWGRLDPTNAPETRPSLSNVGVIGAGVMGVEIAAVHVAAGVPVVLCDADVAVLAGAADAVADELKKGAAEKSVVASRETATTVSLVSPYLRTTADIGEAARCDLVLECIPERFLAKQSLLKHLRELSPERTIVATNTSTIAIERLAACFGESPRFCGLHFLHPVRHRPLVEIVGARQTTGETLAAVSDHARRLEKMPLVVLDRPGFLVNRLLFPYFAESLAMLREGTPAETIEQSAIDFGMSIGPLRFIDEIGLDTTLQAGWVLAEAFAERMVPSPLLVAMIKAGRLGQKNAAGFYRYAGGDAGRCGLDPAVNPIFARWIEHSVRAPSAPMADRLILPMLLEATRMLEEGVVDDVRAIDVAAVFGLGFPTALGGLLWWADAMGQGRILDMLRPFAALGPRMQPSAMLVEMAASGKRFYESASQ